MEKEFVKYSQAVALKELGFDEPCLTSYHYDRTLMDIWSASGFVTNSSLQDPKNYNASNNPKLLKDYLDNPFIAVPTFSQAFRWFREKYNLSGVVLPFNESLFDYRVYSTKEGKHLYGSSEYDNYEAAEPACLTKLIEIVKNK